MSLDTHIYLTEEIKQSDLIVLAARPGVGRISFVLTLAANAATKFQCETTFFCLDKIGTQDVHRWFSRNTQATGISVYIKNQASLSVSEIASRIQRLKSKKKLNLLIINHLNIIKTNQNEKSKTPSSSILQELKTLAKKIQIPIIVLVLLHNRANDFDYVEPQLSDLRDLGVSEHDADAIWFLERKFISTCKAEDYHSATLTITRNGDILKKLSLIFSRDNMTFCKRESE